MANNQSNNLGNLMPTLKRISKEILAYKGKFTLFLISTIISIVFIILGPRELGKATTALFDGITAMAQGTGGIDFNLIGRILLTVLALYLIGSLFSATRAVIMIDITENVAYNIRKRMVEKINNMPMSYFESRPVGETLSRIVNDVDVLGQTMSQSAEQLLSSIATMIGIGIIMFSINTTLALIVLLIVPISILIMRIIMRYSQRYFRSQQYTLGIINGKVEENYSGQRIVKAFNQKESTVNDFEKSNVRLEGAAWRANFFSGITFPIMRFISSLGYVTVVIVGAILVIFGRIHVGDIQAFTQYVNRFTQPITQIAQIVNLLQQMGAAGERVYDFLDAEEEDQASGQELDTSAIEGVVEFDDIEFGYLADQPIINNFSTQVKPGQKVALVGPTGAGKSTIIKLLMRFYDVDSGNIILDGEPAKTYSRKSYQQAIGMVLQDTWLFHGTIRENIRYGRLDATDEEVEEAAKSARVHHFIKSLPGGYDFMISESGDNVSQGQKQLLTIARAILADRPILILDEATSSVDTRTEVLIQEAMDSLMEGRTSFVIAHRLSTIKDSNLILYMENGDVVEQGDHKELMALEGRYANLYNSQFAGA